MEVSAKYAQAKACKRLKERHVRGTRSLNQSSGEVGSQSDMAPLLQLASK